jgi:transposase
MRLLLGSTCGDQQGRHDIEGPPAPSQSIQCDERDVRDAAEHGKTYGRALESAICQSIGPSQVLALHRSEQRYGQPPRREQLRRQGMKHVLVDVIHLVMDNYGTHKTPSIKAWFARHPRFHVHFAPTSLSWLDQVERWFATLTERYIRRGIHRSTRQLEDAIKLYVKVNNADHKPFVWSKTAMTSSPASKGFVCELLTHDTRSLQCCRYRGRNSKS